MQIDCTIVTGVSHNVNSVYSAFTGECFLTDNPKVTRHPHNDTLFSRSVFLSPARRPIITHSTPRCDLKLQSLEKLRSSRQFGFIDWCAKYRQTKYFLHRLYMLSELVSCANRFKLPQGEGQIDGNFRYERNTVEAAENRC